MWASILSLITLILPMILKLVLYLIDKKQNNDKLKEEFLKFISEIEKDIPVKLNSKYRAQVDRLKEQFRIEESSTKRLEQSHANYKQAYHDLHKDYEELQSKLKELQKNG